MKHHTGQFELMQCRLRCLAAAIGMDAPPEGMGNLNVRYDYGLRKWWLVGCAEGDCVLPRSTGARTVEDALHAAEAWLAPEICSTGLTATAADAGSCVSGDLGGSGDGAVDPEVAS